MICGWVCIISLFSALLYSHSLKTELIEIICLKRGVIKINETSSKLLQVDYKLLKKMVRDTAAHL